MLWGMVITSCAIDGELIPSYLSMLMFTVKKNTFIGGLNLDYNSNQG